MAGQVTFGQLQIGDDATATKNFVLKVPASPDGTIALYRGNYGAESQTIFSVANTTGVVTFGNGATITQEAVTAPTLTNSWANAGGAQQTAGYWKDSNGVVHITGAITSGTTTAGVAIMTLPVGYRPTKSEQFICSNNSNTAVAIIAVSSAGVVAPDVTLTNSTFLSLAGISFRAA